MRQIDDAAIARWIGATDLSTLRVSPNVGYPLAFPTIFDEINFMALTQLLNIG